MPVITYQEILSLSKYELESKTSTGSALSLYIFSLPTPPPPPPLSLLFPIDSPSSYNINISQIDFHTIIRQQQEQLVVMQAQIQALLAGGAGRVGEET